MFRLGENICGTGHGTGVGVTKRIPRFHWFYTFLEVSKYCVPIEHHVHIWQVSSQLSCGDTYRIWMWSIESNRCYTRSKSIKENEMNCRNSPSRASTGAFFLIFCDNRGIFSNIWLPHSQQCSNPDEYWEYVYISLAKCQ